MGLVSCRLRKKMTQCESSELNFIEGKMRSPAWETASQRALRNCSKEQERRSMYICDFGEGGVYVTKHIFVAEGFC